MAITNLVVSVNHHHHDPLHQFTLLQWIQECNCPLFFRWLYNWQIVCHHQWCSSSHQQQQWEILSSKQKTDCEQTLWPVLGLEDKRLDSSLAAVDDCVTRRQFPALSPSPLSRQASSRRYLSQQTERERERSQEKMPKEREIRCFSFSSLETMELGGGGGGGDDNQSRSLASQWLCRIRPAVHYTRRQEASACPWYKHPRYIPYWDLERIINYWNNSRAAAAAIK